MLESLSDFQDYERGWDGEDALPLDKKVVRNFISCQLTKPCKSASSVPNNKKSPRIFGRFRNMSYLCTRNYIHCL